MSTAKKQCFVIMPFSKTKEHHSEEYWYRHFNSYLKPLIERNQELEAFRSEPLRGDIAKQIILDLFNSDIIVADLTDHNPNVLWELGVRQSFKPCTVTIAEVDTQIPFHFSHKGILFYNGDHLDNQPFEEKFIQSLKDCLEKPNESDSPVIDALGGRGTLYSIIHKDENNRRVSALKREYSKNKACFEVMVSISEGNQALRLQKKDPMPMEGLLSFPAAESLLVDRYLDQDEEFYTKLIDYVEFINFISAFQDKWVERPIAIENWIVRNKDEWEKVSSYYGAALQKL
jgi:hypothetical protein